jgi:hypothetical protein
MKIREITESKTLRYFLKENLGGGEKNHEGEDTSNPFIEVFTTLGTPKTL